MRRILAFLMAAVLMIGCCGCRTAQEAYTPTGDGLSDGKPAESDNKPQGSREMSLPYYPKESLNPYQCNNYVNRMLFGLVYQGLFAVDADYEPHPVLCQSYKLSRDMRTYTFYLAKATFSDGTELTAADVVASLNHAKKAGFYAGRFGYVKSIKATEEGAVQVELSTPYENFPILLDVPIVKSSELTHERPLGTGPYLYEQVGERFWLRQQLYWWCKAELPVAAGYINLVEATDAVQLRDAFELSGLGMAITDPGSVKYADYHVGSELWACESGVFLYLAAHKTSKVFSNAKVRGALTYAVSRADLAERFFRGFATPAVLPASPDSPYYEEALAAKVTHDPGKLTAAVADAKLTGSEVVLLVNAGDGIRLRVARAVAEMLEQCGLKVKMSELSGQSYENALKNGKYDLYLGQTKLSQNMDLSAFFAPTGALSYGKMNDAVLYALSQEALANKGNYHTLYKKILDDGQLCPLLFRSYAVYAQWGAVTDLQPARDFVFYYDLGRTMADCRIEE